MTLGTAHELGFTKTDLELLRRESGLRTTAQNPTSTAKGMWQGLKSTRTKYAAKASSVLEKAVSPETTDDYEQAVMYKLYIKDRYGTEENALSFHLQNGWY